MKEFLITYRNVVAAETKVRDKIFSAIMFPGFLAFFTFGSELECISRNIINRDIKAR